MTAVADEPFVELVRRLAMMHGVDPLDAFVRAERVPSPLVGHAASREEVVARLAQAVVDSFAGLPQATRAPFWVEQDGDDEATVWTGDVDHPTAVLRRRDVHGDDATWREVVRRLTTPPPGTGA